MRKGITLLLVVGILALGLWINSKINGGKKAEPEEQTVVSEAGEPTGQAVDFTASFEIITNGTKRVFGQTMYHNQSLDLYIENPNPNTVHVKRPGATWNDFFKTLPFSLTKECLVTGTKQTFCSTETKKLRFFLDGVEEAEALGLPIRPGVKLLINFN